MYRKEEAQHLRIPFEVGILAIWDLCTENMANGSPGFQTFCLEFATHVKRIFFGEEDEPWI